jgi:lactoylglutathione lyase
MTCSITLAKMDNKEQKHLSIKILVLVALMGMTLSPFQKTMAQTEKKKSAAVLNHIAVYVVDLKVATDFYKNVFDLEIIPEPFHDGRHTWFSIGPAGHLHIISGARAAAVHDKNEHLCFSVASVDEFINKLKVMKIDFENWAGEKQAVTNRVDGVKQVYFKDPDGHWLEVNDDHK